MPQTHTVPGFRLGLDLLTPPFSSVAVRLGPVLAWPLQDILSRLGFCARVTHPVIAPSPPALPTRFQYHCSTIAQAATPFDSAFVCHTPNHIDRWFSSDRGLKSSPLEETRSKLANPVELTGFDRG